MTKPWPRTSGLMLNVNRNPADKGDPQYIGIDNIRTRVEFDIGTMRIQRSLTWIISRVVSLKGLVVVELHTAPTYETSQDTGPGTGTGIKISWIRWLWNGRIAARTLGQKIGGAAAPFGFCLYVPAL